ncbi:hypothetical protein BJ741DRAFT_634131 [Chytriomyces cf. hyalinus JEL632]|nr:hypothetical protein BJ741DRAFT_634131 [Chytriomyces cf. hyalinus JEL632]
MVALLNLILAVMSASAIPLPQAGPTTNSTTNSTTISTTNTTTASNGTTSDTTNSTAITGSNTTIPTTNTTITKTTTPTRNFNLITPSGACIALNFSNPITLSTESFTGNDFDFLGAFPNGKVSVSISKDSTPVNPAKSAVQCAKMTLKSKDCANATLTTHRIATDTWSVSCDVAVTLN